jgi:hypothetical protein
MTDHHLEVRERSAWKVATTEWDEFACRVLSSSFIGSFQTIAFFRLTHRVIVFELFTPSVGGYTRKIGQCALAVGFRQKRFLESIQILPEFAHLKLAFLDHVIERMGKGSYRYGSHWNIEDIDVAEHLMKTRKVTWYLPFNVDYVDFTQWADYERYIKSVSSNVKRDFTKAESLGPALQLVVAQGFSGIKYVPALTKLRRAVISDKHRHEFSFVRSFVEVVSRIAIYRKSSSVAIVFHEGEPISSFFGISFGDRLYYLTGGTIPNKLGTGSFLFLSLIKDWYRHFPGGKFVMGFTRGSHSPSEYNEGAFLYRRKLRVTQSSGVEIKFAVD